jgi:hypothetical protein
LNLLAIDNGDLKWAIAGRSVEKLSQVADDVAGLEAPNLQQLIANSDDPDSTQDHRVRDYSHQ